MLSSEVLSRGNHFTQLQKLSSVQKQLKKELKSFLGHNFFSVLCADISIKIGLY